MGRPELEFEVVGGPEEGPTLSLPHREFRYAGKFVMSTTGKAVARDGDDLVAAASFNRDRTDGTVAWIRYVTVRDDHRGEGIGPRLCAFLAEHLLGDARRVRIAVNNPFAYQALYRAGFGFTGETTGIAELVLARPGDRSSGTYRDGLDAFRDRDDLAPEERAFLADRRGSGPPEPVSAGGS